MGRKRKGKQTPEGKKKKKKRKKALSGRKRARECGGGIAKLQKAGKCC